MLSQNISTAGLNEQVYDVLHSAILCCELAPGEKLHVDQIAQQLGVSPTPVKVALNRLATEGLAVIHPRKGSYVSSFDLTDLLELLDVRRVLELRAAELAVDRISEADLQRMRALLAEMEAFTNLAAEQQQARRDRIAQDVAFHEILVAASGNRRLMEMHRSMRSHVLIARGERRSTSYSRTDADHRAILSALERRSLPELRAAIDSHLQNVIQTLLDEVNSGALSASVEAPAGIEAVEENGRAIRAN